jgi:hypothetical protein
MENSWHTLRPKQVVLRGRAGPTQHLTYPRRRGAQAVFLALAAFLTSSAWALDAPPGAQPVPFDIQDAVEAAIVPILVLPQTAKWDFAFMVDHGNQKLVCGTVNYQSSLQQYQGPKRFYALLKNGHITRAQLQDPPSVDTAGAEAYDFRVLCPALFTAGKD